jgi:hypothetical protein
MNNMRITDYISMIRCNMHGRKKYGIIISILLFLTFIIFFLVNALTDSLNKAADKMMQLPLSQTYVISDDEEGTVKKELTEKLGKEEGIADIYSYIYEINADIKINQQEKNSMALNAWSKGMDSYIISGCAPENGEILIPQYLMMDGMEGYVSGDSFIGKEVSVIIWDYRGNPTEYEMTVSGTYDNIYMVTGGTVFFIGENQARILYDQSTIGMEDGLQELMEQTGNYEKEYYSGFDREYYVAVQLKSGYDREWLREISGKAGWKQIQHLDSGLYDMLDFIRLIGNIAVVILFVVAFVIMQISIFRDIYQREHEIALQMILGYQRRQLGWIMTGEYFLRILESMIAALVSGCVIFGVLNLFIKNYGNMEYQIYQIHVTGKISVQCMLLALILFCGVCFYIHTRFRKFSIIRKLREG